MTDPLTLNAADDGNWAPQACTLPTAERPLRLAEFDDLFSSGLQRLHRQSPTQLQLTLDTATEATARDLTARETSCCSFFAFTFSPGPPEHVLLKVTVPQAHIDVLDALATRAERHARAPRPRT